MNTYIALLRGINVSGQKKVPMAELRELLFKQELHNVETYIQSGNVVFQSSFDSLKLKTIIEESIREHFGFNVPVLVKTSEELQIIFNACPFPKEEKENSYFILPYENPNDDLIKAVSKIEYPNESFFIAENCIYLYVSTGYGRAKCNNNFFEKKLKITATARNYKTMVKLLSLSAVKS